MPTRKEKARKGSDNGLNGVGPWAFVFCMPYKHGTLVAADNMLEICLVPERSVLSGPFKIFISGHLLHVS